MHARRLALVAGLVAMPVAAGFAGPVAPESELIVSLSRGDSEKLLETIPVSRIRGAEPRVVLSQRIKAGGGLERGDVMRATAELQLTTTCVDGSQRCIGRQYGFSPLMSAQLVIGSSPGAISGSSADPISKPVERRCNQQRPNRNHHCVFPFRVAKRLTNISSLPCDPQGCFVNMVASASHPSARDGNLVVVGADRPDGSIDQDKGRVDVVIARGDGVTNKKLSGARRVDKFVPIRPSGDAGRRVVRSLRIDGSRRGDVLVADGRHSMDISGLPYNVFIGTRLIVGTKPSSTTPGGYARASVANGGAVTELNGFNCTFGKSAYRNPCPTRKAATIVVRDTPRKPGEKIRPLFVNLVVAGFPKLASAEPSDRMRARRGEINVTRLRVDSAE